MVTLSCLLLLHTYIYTARPASLEDRRRGAEGQHKAGQERHRSQKNRTCGEGDDNGQLLPTVNKTIHDLHISDVPENGRVRKRVDVYQVDQVVPCDLWHG